MTAAERFERLQYHSEKTHDDAIKMMNEFGKVLVVRPTGFGKTRLLIRLAKEYATRTGKKVMYVYPIDIIKTEIYGKKEYMEDGIIDKYVEFVSYQTLTLRAHEKGANFWKDILSDDYSLIMLDEVHRAGSEGFLEVYEAIEELIQSTGIHMIGVTATPNRMMDTDEQNVTETLFNGISVYKYELADAVNEGIIPKIILAQRRYKLQKVVGEVAADLKEAKRVECVKLNKLFNEDSFNVELGKTLNRIGDEPSYLYKYIKMAGYNMCNPSEDYFKFIVFFNNKLDMVERGPEVEEWFRSALNVVGKRDQKFRKDFEVHSYYVASSDTPESELKAVVNEDKEHRSFYKKTKKLNELGTEHKKCDLIMTINMVNMGYHVDNITGIVMLRGTRSEIVFYQQLGRCISVKADRSPIVYDMVQNADAKFWSNRTKNGTRDVKNGTGDGIGQERERKDYKTMLEDMGFKLIAEDDADIFSEFIGVWSDTNHSENEMITWMYTDRHAPICQIATDLKKSCTDVANVLVKSGIELRQEDAMYNMYVLDAEKKDKNAIAIMKYLYSKKAAELYAKLKGTIQVLYEKLSKMISGGKN